MSIHVDRKCKFCGAVNDNEIYVNWASGTPKEVIDDFYNNWVCWPCKTSQ